MERKGDETEQKTAVRDPWREGGNMPCDKVVTT